MAARTRTAVTKGTMPVDWRRRIQTSMLLNRLSDHVKGDVDLSNTQVTAALGLLRKSLPDMATVQHEGAGGGPVEIAVTHRVIHHKS